MNPNDPQPRGTAPEGAAIVGEVDPNPHGPGPFVMAADTLEGNKVVDPAGDDLGTIDHIMVDVMGASAPLFPLKNPAIITIPLGFAAGILVSMLAPEKAAREAYDAKERRMIMGVE